MDRTKIKQIADYLKDLEEGLVELDYRGTLTLGDLNRLYVIITDLMQATFETDDRQLKLLLASLEYKARKCKHCIEGLLAIKN